MKRILRIGTNKITYFCKKVTHFIGSNKIYSYFCSVLDRTSSQVRFWDKILSVEKNPMLKSGKLRHRKGTCIALPKT